VASSILSDNGVTSGSAGLKTSADSTGVLALQTTTAGGAATTAVTIDTSQNVGIGASSGLDGKLTLNQSTGAYLSVQYNGTSKGYFGTGNQLVTGGGTSDLGISTTGSGNMLFASAGTERMRIDSSGNVGIGTTSINAKLNVKATNNTYAGGALALLDAAGTSKSYITGIASSIYFGDNATNDCAVINQYGVGLGGNAPTSGLGVRFPATQSASSDANTLDDYEEGTWTPSLGGNTTYVAQVGAYTKIGRFVCATFEVNVSSIGTGSSTTISGLPFTSFSTPTNGMGGMVGYFTGGANSVVMITLRIDLGSTTFGVASIASAATGMNAGLAFFANGTRILGSICYFTA